MVPVCAVVVLIAADSFKKVRFMRINADFSRPAIVQAHQYQWVSSPQGGVERVMLDRVGAEQARATSIVRYAAGSDFPPHMHPGGEEILVLSGTFSDEHGHYKAGWYLRNPPGSSHQPFSVEGAVIFVKLQQMKPSEQCPVRINTADPSSWHQQGERLVCPLFADASEQVRLQRCGAEQALLDEAAGVEILVLSGSVECDGMTLETGSWLRLPDAAAHSPLRAGMKGATVYLKTGHLPHELSQA